MQSFGEVILTNVPTNGVLTQIYPDTVTPGSGSLTSQTMRRYPNSGVLYRCEVNPSGAVGGVL